MTTQSHTYKPDDLLKVATEKEERRRAYESRMDAEPCQGCRAAAAGLLWDVEGSCSKCGWEGDTSHLHTCKTGWRWRVCGSCNEQQPETNQPRHL